MSAFAPFHVQGKTIVESTLNGANRRLPVYPLRVHRFDPGLDFYIRILSERYWGLFTHFKGKSHYCKGAECPAVVHNLERVWKGYASAEVYREGKIWMPIALEMTEHLELDMRGRFARGQVWKIGRGAVVKKKTPPVVGELIEQCDADTFPPALDLVPCLKSLYHVFSLDLEQENPLPPRTIVQDSQGDLPLPLREAAEKKRAFEESCKAAKGITFAELQKQRMNGVGVK